MTWAPLGSLPTRPSPNARRLARAARAAGVTDVRCGTDVIVSGVEDVDGAPAGVERLCVSWVVGEWHDEEKRR